MESIVKLLLKLAILVREVNINPCGLPDNFIAEYIEECFLIPIYWVKG
jgi:hypothetical protein